jgi:hypothetical protein
LNNASSEPLSVEYNEISAYDDASSTPIPPVYDDASSTPIPPVYDDGFAVPPDYLLDQRTHHHILG